MKRSIVFLGLASMALAGCGVFGGDGKPDITPTVGKREPILSKIETGAQVDPSIANVAVLIPPATANASWTQPGGNASKAMGHLQLPETLTRAWTAQIGGANQRVRLASAPVIDGGRVYAVGTDAVVHAFDAQTGARAWQMKLNTDSGMRMSLFGGGVSSDGERLFATNGAGDLVALNPADGAEIWRANPAGPLRGAPTISLGNVYVMTQDNQLFALSAANGEVEWNRAGTAGQAGVFGVAAPAAGQGTVIAGYSTGELNAYRYENGRELWGDALSRTSISTSVATLTDIDADPIIDRGRVYALGQGGRMAAYELVSGQRIWELNIAGISTPVVAGEWIFALTDEAKLLCIARSTGRVRWISQLQRFKDEKDREGPIYWVGPVLAGNRLIVANTRGEVGAVSVGEGSYSTITELDEGVSVPPVVAGGTLYVLDDSGTITALR